MHPINAKLQSYDGFMHNKNTASENAEAAMRETGVEAMIVPIRGGTDGARLSYQGLPCPNLSTGGMNFHGKFEYCSLTTMKKAQQVILNLATLWAK